jgi:hypothetical protein
MIQVSQVNRCNGLDLLVTLKGTTVIDCFS